MRNNTLEVQNLSKWYIQNKVKSWILHNISILFEPNCLYAITGASGSGKSTFIHILAGLEAPSAGTLIFNKAVINKFNDTQKGNFLNTSIGLVFQNPYLIKELSVIENVMLKGLIAGYNYQECFKKAQVLLEQMGLAQKINTMPAQLSGGQQQRVALARALLNKPSFLIADEPTGSLDINNGLLIINLILAQQKETGMGVILSSHDKYVTERMHVIYELKGGTLSNCR